MGAPANSAGRPLYSSMKDDSSSLVGSSTCAGSVLRKCFKAAGASRASEDGIALVGCHAKMVPPFSSMT